METAKLFPWFILLNPLIAAVLILVATRKNHGVSAAISTLSALFGIVAALCAWSLPEVHSAVQWIDFGKALQIPLGVKLDHLAKTMLPILKSIDIVTCRCDSLLKLCDHLQAIKNLYVHLICPYLRTHSRLK